MTNQPISNQPISNQPISTLSIPVDLIDPNPNQPRQEFDEAKLKELANSIEANGLVQPIIIEPYNGKIGGRYFLHDGERRLRAVKIVGWPEIDAIIVPPGSDHQRLLTRAVVANIQRADLTPIELANAFQQMADLGMNDKQIAGEVGKSRSTVANARRLLNLPLDVQAQVEKGDLSERQAMALLPLYQLPEAVRTKIVENHWDGRKLQNPKNLTSDHIRHHLRSAIRTMGQELSLIEPDTEYTGDHIRCPTCAACELYTKVGQDMLCLDEACLLAKQNQVIVAYLGKAVDSTGLPVLDPYIHYEWDQKSDFYSTGSTLETALQKKCPNLHLTFARHSWDSGPGPEGFPQCRYTCLHNGQGCVCANASKEEAKRATKEKERAIQQLKSKTHYHLAKIAQDSPDAFLRAILFSTTGYGIGHRDEKVLNFSPEKVITRLARWLLDHNAGITSYLSLGDNQQRINEWLIKMDFPPLDGADNPLLTLNVKLERIVNWTGRLSRAVPTPEALAGNLVNLADLSEQAGQLHETDPAAKAALDEKNTISQLETLYTILVSIQATVEHGRGDVEIEHVSWLLTVPSGDVNFKNHLKTVANPATLRYVLALFPLFSQGKTAREAIERRLRSIERQQTKADELFLGSQKALEKIKTWFALEQHAPSATPQQWLNKGAALSDLIYDVNKLIRDHGETAERRALLTEIEQLESRVIAAVRAVLAQTNPSPGEKEVQPA